MSSVLCEKQEAAAANANDKKVDAADKKHDKRGIFEEGYGGGGDFGGHDFGGGYGGGYGGGHGGGHDWEEDHHHHVHHEKTIVNVKKVKMVPKKNRFKFAMNDFIHANPFIYTIDPSASAPCRDRSCAPHKNCEIPR